MQFINNLQQSFIASDNISLSELQWQMILSTKILATRVCVE